MKVRFISPANIEMDEAVRYYDHQLPGLGFRFFQEVDTAIERIRFMPEAWSTERRCYSGAAGIIEKVTIF